MGDLETMRTVLRETQRVVDDIEPSQLDNPSPCAEWTVRDVLNHVTGGADMFAVCVEEGGISDARLVELVSGDNLGSDYRGSFAAASKRAISAFEKPGAAEKIVTLPFGEMPAGVAMRIAVFDVTVHAWDLARGTGQDTALDRDVLEAALQAGREMIGPDMRGTGLFDAEIAPPAGAPLQDQLAAFAGRRP